MSKVAAIICEFNPLHKGHKVIIDTAHQYGEIVVGVMSGNFTERSEAAVFDKYKRAEAAVEVGVDLVLELPFPWSCAGGEGFALGGVTVAVGIGADTIVFGSECGDIGKLKDGAEICERTEFLDIIKAEDSNESGAAVAFEKAMAQYGYKFGSNDKLGMQYIRAARKTQSEIDFVTRKREEGVEYLSSTEIREKNKNGENISDYLCPEVVNVYGENTDVISEKLEELEYLYYRAFYSGDGIYAEGSGGVAERLVSAAQSASLPCEFYSSAQTKKYTSSRLRRAALFGMLGVTKEDIYRSPEYTVLLAANDKGREYLSQIRYDGMLPVITKPSSPSLNENAEKQYKMLTRADEIYSLCLKKGRPYGEYLRRYPYIKKAEKQYRGSLRESRKRQRGKNLR